jgi:filamentous hemagglutinin
VKQARSFIKFPPEGTLYKLRANGDKIVYNQQTNFFAVGTQAEVPKTMFKPDPIKHGYPTNLDYFNAQK